MGESQTKPRSHCLFSDLFNQTTSKKFAAMWTKNHVNTCSTLTVSVWSLLWREVLLQTKMLLLFKKRSPISSIQLSHYLLVPLPLLLKLPSTWYRYSDFLQGNEPIPGLYQKAGSALSGPIHKQAGRPQRRLPHQHFAAAQMALPHPATTNKQRRKSYFNY